MPRYHFHVYDGIDLPDRTGTELADVGEARVEAVRLAGALLKDEPKRAALGQNWHMEVTDGTGRVQFRLDLYVADPLAIDDKAQPA